MSSHILTLPGLIHLSASLCPSRRVNPFIYFYNRPSLFTFHQLYRQVHVCVCARKCNSFLKLIILFLVELGLHCCVQTFSTCSEQGLLITVASLAAEGLIL